MVEFNRLQLWNGFFCDKAAQMYKASLRWNRDAKNSVNMFDINEEQAVVRFRITMAEFSA
jgi:hypothetical protein